MASRIIIWDWNGTLLDDVSLCTQIINEFLNRYGLKTISEDEYRKIFCFPVRKYYERLGFDLKQISFEKIGNEFIRRYEKDFSNLKLRNGAVEILEYFNNAGFYQGIISARKQSALINDLKYFSIEKYFDFVIGINDDLAHGKEAIFRSFVEKNRGEKIMIGDTEYDCSLAKKYDVKIILIKNGHNAVERLLDCDVPLVDDLQELANFIRF